MMDRAPPRGISVERTAVRKSCTRVAARRILSAHANARCLTGDWGEAKRRVSHALPADVGAAGREGRSVGRDLATRADDLARDIAREGGSVPRPGEDDQPGR